jgi:hypothetical protein
VSDVYALRARAECTQIATCVNQALFNATGTQRRHRTIHRKPFRDSAQVDAQAPMKPYTAPTEQLDVFPACPRIRKESATSRQHAKPNQMGSRGNIEHAASSLSETACRMQYLPGPSMYLDGNAMRQTVNSSHIARSIVITHQRVDPRHAIERCIDCLVRMLRVMAACRDLDKRPEQRPCAADFDE